MALAKTSSCSSGPGPFSRNACDQDSVGAGEKCRRMTCALFAGLWVLRDPEQAAYHALR